MREIVPNTRTLNILVAEDNPQGGFVLEKQLQRLGHTYQLTTDGKQAIDALCANDFDLILMDKRMPELSGYEAAQIIREGGSGSEKRSIPIVSISANNAQEDIVDGREKGIDAFLTKPIHIHDLRDLLETYAVTVEA